jgi:hypothetical protein
MLDRGVQAYEEADFDRALHTFDTAVRNADLSVEELLRLFEMRALVHHALGEEASMRADLERLVAVRSTYRLSRLAPPSVREVYLDIVDAKTPANSVELRIEERELDGQSLMVAQVLRVPPGLVDHTTLQCTVDNGARTVSRTSQGTSASVRLPDSGIHNGCSATARTRQGGVLFSSTLNGRMPLVPSAANGRFSMPKYKRGDEAAAKKKKKWPWIVAVSAVVVAGGVTAGVLLSQRANDSGQQSGAVTVNW